MGQISTAAGGILTGYSNQFGAITSVVKGVLCIPQLLSPNNLKYLTASILTTLSNAAGQWVAGMANFVSSTISRTIDNVTGVIGSQLNAINNFIKDINETITLIKTLITSLDDIAKNTLQFLTDQENCAFAAAELGKCIISDILDDLPLKVSKDLSVGTLAYNNKVVDVTSQLLAPEKAITQFVNKTQVFANKARIQQFF